MKFYANAILSIIIYLYFYQMWEIYKGFLLKYCTVDESAVVKFPKYSIKQKHFTPFHSLTLLTVMGIENCVTCYYKLLF